MGRSNLRHEYSLRDEYIVFAGATDEAISKCIPTSAPTAHSIFTYFEATDVVLGAGEEIEVALQHEVADGCWLNVGVVATVKIDTDGGYAIRLDRGVPVEAMVLPLGQPTRLVITTGATSSLKISNVNATIGE